MAKTTVVEQPRPVTSLMPLGDVIRILVAGVVIGLVTVALYVMLDKYVFTPALCNSTTVAVGRCENKLYFASALATVLGALVGLLAMVQLRVFRPLLVVLLATVSLWNVVMLTATFPWWGTALVSALVFLLAYGAFAWLVQIRNLLLAALLGVIVTVIVRLVLVL